MAEKLTPQQAEAVRNRGGRLLVSAAAGSGKTKVLVDRLMRYLTDPSDPANIDDFLIITFTEAAAAELRGKIAAKLTERIAEDSNNKHLQKQMQRLHLAQISTIHAFCSRLLRDFAYKLDISSDFRLADEKEAAELQILAMEQVLEHAYGSGSDSFYAFVDTQGLGRDDRLVPQIVLDIYEKAQCHLNPDQWLQECVAGVDIGSIGDASKTIWGEYLIRDLHETLDLIVDTFLNCIANAERENKSDKSVKVLQSDLDVLRDLRNRNTWDEIFSARKPKFGTLTFSKDFDPETRFAIKESRDRCKELLSEKLSVFTEDNARVLQDIQTTAQAQKGLVETVVQFRNAYVHLKKNRRVVDFTDLEHSTLDLLVGKSRTSVTLLAEEIGSRFREVMVDEYQDTNEVQDCIFSALTGKRQNCFMVGDVKQSIYQFRLADPGIFIEKYNTFAPAEEASAGQGRKVLLSSNFRSSGGVISAVNDVFENCMSPRIGGLYYGADEKLKEGIPHTPINEPEVELHCIDVQHAGYAEEAALVADRICTLLDGTHMVRDGDVLRPMKAEDIVILLRAPKTSGYYYQTALESRGVACTMESSTDLLQTEEIGFLRSLLQTISNPLQDISLAAVMMSRMFGFTANEMAKIRCGTKKLSLFESVMKCDDQKAQSFVLFLRKLRRVARTTNVSQLLDYIVSGTQMDSIFSALPDGDTRKENIFAFAQLATSFEANKQGDLERFLTYLDNLEQKSGFTVSSDENTGAVQIMSIHKSKGLEFPVVFLSGLSKAFSSQDQRKAVVCDRVLGLGLYCADSTNRVKYPNIAYKAIAAKIESEQLSEELRVLYVAMTRARDRLIMTYARRKIAKHLTEIGRRAVHFPPLLRNLDVSSSGDWVLQTAMGRSESKALFDISVKPEKLVTSEQKWSVFFHEEIAMNSAGTHRMLAVKAKQISEETAMRMKECILFQYPYLEATNVASKLTATQLKGRVKDSEIAEHAENKQPYQFRKPAFTAPTGDSRVYGNVMHKAMQYIRFENCVDFDSVSTEIKRMVSEGILTEAESAKVDIVGIAAFFASDVGTRIRSAKKGSVLREFKFSLLDDASRYADGLENEKVLLQGIVDCAIVEDGGITIVDFKTDHVSEETLLEHARRYTDQINTYAYAMERIFEKKICKTMLYFFHLRRFVTV